jgi:hypothetical protein
MTRFLNDAQRKAAAEAAARWRARQRGQNAPILKTKRVANAGSFTTEKLTLHGMHATPTYQAWKSMKQRCLNENSQNFARYGGRGITVCHRWMRFENFLADMGVKPVDLTLERKDTNGNYEPSNVVWASRKQQARNTRRNRYVEIDGRRLTLSEWASERGVSRFLIRDRLDRGVGCREAVFGA